MNLPGVWNSFFSDQSKKHLKVCTEGFVVCKNIILVCVCVHVFVYVCVCAMFRRIMETPSSDICK